ncbi:MAG: hypothetical protein Q4A73_07290, partial [Campylobacter sp.]|nr:hypothetical protein [Campylobacter sp.]
RDFLEKVILMDGGAHQIYNATEGGARIKGTVEKPFSECCAEFLHEKKPHFITPPVLSEAKRLEYTLKAYAKLALSAKKCEELEGFLKEKQDRLELILAECMDENLQNLQEGVDTLVDLVDLVDYDLAEILQPLIIQFRLGIAKYISIVPKNPQENLEKNLALFKEHLWYIQILVAHLRAKQEALEAGLDGLLDLSGEEGAGTLAKFRANLSRRENLCFCFHNFALRREYAKNQNL